MGFKEEVKVYLSTIGASQTDTSMSYGEWRLKTPVTAPNANYRIKCQVTNALFPNTYPKISPDRQNNKLTFVYDTTANIDVSRCISAGRKFTAVVHQPIPQLSWTDIQDTVNNAIYTAVALPGTSLYQQKLKPQIFFDTNTYNTFCIRVVDYSMPDESLPGSTDPKQSDTTWLAEENQISYYYKLVTQADNSLLPDSDLRLAGIIGFPRSEVVAAVSKDAPLDKYLSGIPGGLIRAPRQPDMTGTKYIKIASNLKTSSIDPNTLETNNILCVVPITNGEGDSQGVYWIGSVQQPQYITLAQWSLDNIYIQLYDDHGIPLGMHNDWYIELSVLFEEEEKLDVYRGLSNFSEPVLRNNIYDPDGYRRLHREIQGTKRTIEQMEAEERMSSMSNLNRN